MVREPVRRWKSSSISRSSRGASRRRSGGTLSRRSEKSIRCFVPNVITRCASCRSSTTRRSSSASCDMLACGWMRFASMAFASRQALDRRWRNWWRWRASSSAANSSSSRGLTIRCRTMTAIHRSGRCDKLDKESRRGCHLKLSCDIQ